MKTITKLEQKWLEDREYMTRYMLVFTGSVFVHLILAMMFAISGHWFFAAMNGISIVFFMVWLHFFAYMPVNAFLLLALYLNVMLHAVVYDLFLGMTPGFFLYPLILIPATFFLSTLDLKHSHTMLYSALLSILSALVMLTSLISPPLAPLKDAELARQFFQVNLLLCTLLLCAFTFECMTEMLNSQKKTYHTEMDTLTGLRNHYGFIREIERIHGMRYSVVMCDIDNFKQINDLYGHSIGDELLTRIGHMLSTSINKTDVICRWGGEEFLLVLCSDFEDALTLVEQLHTHIPEIEVNVGEAKVHVTLTFGIAGSMEADSFDTLIKIAETNLQRGKRSGKNCIVHTASHISELPSAVPADAELDTSFLNEPLFDAFSATSDTTYIYACNLSTNVSRWSRTAV